MKSVQLRSLLFGFLALAPISFSRGQVITAPRLQTSFVFFQRAEHQVKNGTEQAFQEVVDSIQQYLRANNVTTAGDIRISSSGAELPLSDMLEMAESAKATSLLYIVVDRPTMKPLKVTITCFYTMGRRLWQEEASSRALSVETVDHPERVTLPTLQKLREKLNSHLEQPGLMQVPAEQARALTRITGTDIAPPNQENQADTIRLESGTPVHLLVNQTVSSKTAKRGDAVKLQVFGDVKVSGLIVIANKAPAIGTIDTTENAGRAWRAGKIVLKLQTVTLVKQQQQGLRAWSAAKGQPTDADLYWANAITESYGFGLLALPFVPLQHGNEAFLYRGTVLDAAVANDLVLSRADIEGAQPKTTEAHHGPGSVTFYYPDFGKGSAVDIWCGNVKLGHLQRGGKFTLSLPSGNYSLKFARKVKAGF